MIHKRKLRFIIRTLLYFREIIVNFNVLRNREYLEDLHNEETY